MRLPTVALGVTLLALAGCDGPKDTCEGSFNSWHSCLKGHDWECSYELLTPEFKRKVGSSKKLARAMESDWFGSKSFKFNVYNVAETKAGVCTANGSMNYTVKIRGESPHDFNDVYFSYTFHLEKDGLWYIDLPGAEKLQSW